MARDFTTGHTIKQKKQNVQINESIGRDGNGAVLGRGLVPLSPSPFKKTVPVPAKKTERI